MLIIFVHLPLLGHWIIKGVRDVKEWELIRYFYDPKLHATKL